MRGEGTTCAGVVSLSVGIRWVSGGMCTLGGVMARVGGRICTLVCTAVGNGVVVAGVGRWVCTIGCATLGNVVSEGRDEGFGAGEVVVVKMVLSF